jgi:hypothetical protein
LYLQNGNAILDSDTSMGITPIPCDAGNITLYSSCGTFLLYPDAMGSFANTGTDDTGRSVFTSFHSSTLSIRYNLEEGER